MKKFLILILIIVLITIIFNEQILKNSLKTIGDIDYNNGVVDIKNLHITALADLDLEISIRPLSNDVVSALTQIVHIPPEHLKVVAIPDPTASGDLRGGYNYKFTSSRS